jgi:hypothetical protein
MPAVRADRGRWPSNGSNEGGRHDCLVLLVDSCTHRQRSAQANSIFTKAQAVTAGLRARSVWAVPPTSTIWVPFARLERAPDGLFEGEEAVLHVMVRS